MRLLDDRGLLTALMRHGNAPDRSPKTDFSPAIPADFDVLELALRKLLADREFHSSQTKTTPTNEGHRHDVEYSTKPSREDRSAARFKSAKEFILQVHPVRRLASSDR